MEAGGSRSLCQHSLVSALFLGYKQPPSSWKDTFPMPPYDLFSVLPCEERQRSHSSFSYKTTNPAGLRPLLFDLI